jgi:hypothetical protein
MSYAGIRRHHLLTRKIQSIAGRRISPRESTEIGCYSVPSSVGSSYHHVLDDHIVDAGRRFLSVPILELTRAAYDPSQPTSSSRPPSTDEHSPVDKSTAAENVERSIDHKSRQPSSFSTIALHFHSSLQPPLQRHTEAFRPFSVPTPQYGISICSESDGLWRL